MSENFEFSNVVANVDIVPWKVNHVHKCYSLFTMDCFPIFSFDLSVNVITI